MQDVVSRKRWVEVANDPKKIENEVATITKATEVGFKGSTRTIITKAAEVGSGLGYSHSHSLIEAMHARPLPAHLPPPLPRLLRALGGYRAFPIRVRRAIRKGAQ